MELPECDDEAQCKEHTYHSATEEELQARYSFIPKAPRKKSDREIAALQQHEGESDDVFAKHLQWNSRCRPIQRQKHTGEETSLKMPDPAPPPPPPHIRIQNPYFKIININDPSSSCSMDSAPIIDNPVPSGTEKGIQTNLGMPLCHVTDFGVGVAGVPSDAPTMSWHRIPMHGDSSAFPAHVVLPYIPDGSENLLQLHADDVCSIASCHPILEDTNKHIVFIRPPFPDNMQLIDIILDHLAHNQGVKLEGF
ncbi:hypothetical protein F5146DRAFT_1005365 [Armillaria mellea]|nr:hypothetical protein F5146DRAFT_1005365 [Armillaria mellea]